MRKILFGQDMIHLDSQTDKLGFPLPYLVDLDLDHPQVVQVLGLQFRQMQICDDGDV